MIPLDPRVCVDIRGNLLAPQKVVGEVRDAFGEGACVLRGRDGRLARETGFREHVAGTARGRGVVVELDGVDGIFHLARDCGRLEGNLDAGVFVRGSDVVPARPVVGQADAAELSDTARRGLDGDEFARAPVVGGDLVEHAGVLPGDFKSVLNVRCKVHSISFDAPPM